MTREKIIEDIYDTIMKNTKYELLDFTKFENSFLDQHYNEIDLGEFVISIRKKGEGR
jgi:hypothetical protein